MTLPDGTGDDAGHLPDPRTRRWVASRKAAVVRAVESGLISRREAPGDLRAVGEELDGWTRAVARHGEPR